MSAVCFWTSIVILERTLRIFEELKKTLPKGGLREVEQREIEADWSNKLEPCNQIINEDEEFGEKKQDCLMMLIKAENETEESQ